jgi:SAM-dependent methyltransferase
MIVRPFPGASGAARNLRSMGNGSSPPCRLCGSALERTFVDLGLSPLANSYLEAEDLLRGETFYPLRVFVCDQCLLVQLPVFAAPDAIFDEYAYFSSVSDSWVEHARRYVEATVPRFDLDAGSRIVEIASNDGYLLQFFVERGIPALGVEPSANVAAAAVQRGIPTVVEFFGAELGERLAAERGAADLVIGNNVLAHVPDLHDFVEGLRRLLAPAGVATMEFPHLLRLIRETQFDTIYHEHFSYLSLHVVERLFGEHGLRLFDVEELSTHGGSLRIYACADDRPESEALERVREAERGAALDRLDGYEGFEEAVRGVKRGLLAFLAEEKRLGRSVVGYGAAAKGNTLLNYCGIRSDFLDYVVDRSPHKQGRFLPGTRLPILDPDEVRRTRPDVLLVLPWNLADEVAEQMRDVREWGCRLVVPIPEVRVLA